MKNGLLSATMSSVYKTLLRLHSIVAWKIVYLKNERVILSDGDRADELVDDVTVGRQKVGGFSRQVRCIVKIILQRFK